VLRRFLHSLSKKNPWGAISHSFTGRRRFATEEGNNTLAKKAKMFGDKKYIAANKSTPFQQEAEDGVGPYDVLCGRHKAAFNNVGNRRFRITIELWLSKYNGVPSRTDKSLVIHEIVSLIKNNGGRFLHRSGGSWKELTEKQAREKVGHALRDMNLAARFNKKEGSMQEQSPSPDLLSSMSTVPMTEPAARQVSFVQEDFQADETSSVDGDTEDELDDQQLDSHVVAESYEKRSSLQWRFDLTTEEDAEHEGSMPDLCPSLHKFDNAFDPQEALSWVEEA
jgi:hypothetical protein